MAPAGPGPLIDEPYDGSERHPGRYGRRLGNPLRADAARNVAQIRSAAIAAFHGRGLSTPLEDFTAEDLYQALVTNGLVLRHRPKPARAGLGRWTRFFVDSLHAT